MKAVGKRKVVALSGGIGGAKLALGLTHAMAPEDLTIVANIGDDFEHLGLSISPDVDTLVYTLAGIADPEKGWGRKDETWTFMHALEALGGEAWFQLGDGDLALHVERTRRLHGGETLSSIMQDLARRLGIVARILPASDDPVHTRLETSEGWLDFQDYFVRRRCEPTVKEIVFAGAEEAKAQPDILAALQDNALRAVILCPSNPFISIDPILAIPGLRETLQTAGAPVIAVSPIIGGQAVKGPTAKMMGELGLALTAVTIAERYADILDGYVLDVVDAHLGSRCSMPTVATQTMMSDLDAKIALAKAVLAFSDRLTADG